MMSMSDVPALNYNRLLSGKQAVFSHCCDGCDGCGGGGGGGEGGGGGGEGQLSSRHPVGEAEPPQMEPQTH